MAYRLQDPKSKEIPGPTDPGNVVERVLTAISPPLGPKQPNHSNSSNSPYYGFHNHWRTVTLPVADPPFGPLGPRDRLRRDRSVDEALKAKMERSRAPPFCLEAVVFANYLKIQI